MIFLWIITWRTYTVKSFICKLVFFSYFLKLLLSVNMMSDSLSFNLGVLKKVNHTAVPLDSSNSIWCSTHYHKLMPEIKLASHTITTRLSDGRWASACTKDKWFLLEKCRKKHTAQIFRSYLIIVFGYHIFNLFLHKKFKILKKSFYGVYHEVDF